ncbi:hypothetical protein Taro_014535 [Colocasia esculenta]|uniref:Pentatricopeptide repeat-containing protein n=1 Tax=Colocasia esculenta TaxID=4460 RepID=A0A843UIE8_COLES|nr:hypothetical protein [Colocasia esculenta]
MLPVRSYAPLAPLGRRRRLPDLLCSENGSNQHHSTARLLPRSTVYALRLRGSRRRGQSRKTPAGEIVSLIASLGVETVPLYRYKIVPPSGFGEFALDVCCAESKVGRLFGRTANLFESAIVRLSKDGCFREALESFQYMKSLRIKPTKFMLCSILNSCSKAPDIFLGLQIHAHIVQSGYAENVFIGAQLLDLYSKSGAMEDARKVFDCMGEHDHVSWTSIMSGFSQNGCGAEAVLSFRKMLNTDIRPNCHTFATIISACKWLEAASQVGPSLHALVIKFGFKPNSFVISSLIDFYSKHGEIDQALELFENSFEKDVILYNSIMSGYSQNMLGEEALKLFLEMQEKDVVPTVFTLATLLNCCGSLALLQLGKQMHSLIVKFGWERNVAVGGSLIDMYSKCASIDDACRSFDFASERNNIMWTSMITGYAQNGRGLESLKLFNKFLEEGGKPDNVCFTTVLTACNHAGLLDKANCYFKLMTGKYGLVPELDQYACMIDLYGRTGHLREAKEAMENMPFEPNAVLWSSFLGSCKTYCETKFGREAAMKLFKIEPNSAAPYITLANTLAEVGMWNEVAEVRRMMKSKGVRKGTSWSWIEVDNMIHVFCASDKSHPKSPEIYEELDKVNVRVREGS